VSGLHANIGAGTLSFQKESVPASFGRAGVCPAADRREGDGKTPLGTWPLLTALLRPDRGLPAPRTVLPWRWLRVNDGWSDDPMDAAYNRPVRHPHTFGAEALWRADNAYDVIVILGHNTPPIKGLGSAIFLHCTQPDSRPTEGCVATDRDTLMAWLPRFTPSTSLRID